MNRCVAWVIAGLVVSLPVAVGAATAVVGVDAEVRTAPHQVAPAVETLTRGQQVTVSDEATNGWRFVQLEGGRAGYVPEDQLEVTVTATGSAPSGVAGPPTMAAPGPPPAAAPATSWRLTKPFIVRPEMNVTFNGDFKLFGAIADASSLGMTVGRSVHERVAIEVTLGFAPGQSGSSTSQGVTMYYDVAAGLAAMGAARVAPLMSSGGRHALTLAGGAYALLNGGYGPTAFAHGEAAYEFRGQYVTALVGYGANLTLNDSERQTVFCGIFGSTCDVGFRRGDVLSHFRVGVGMTF